jgi:hypothetical protein
MGIASPVPYSYVVRARRGHSSLLCYTDKDSQSPGQWPVNTVKAYKIKIRENENYGELGLLVDVGRPYFSPFSGVNVAHDIIEHPTNPHPHGVIDELMALGGIIAGRIGSGWHSPGRYRRIDYSDLSSDISRMAIDCFNGGEDFCPIPCGSYIRDGDIVEQIKGAIRSGIREAEGEVDDSLDIDIDSTAGWICRGYQEFRRRFNGKDVYTISTHLFDKITLVADNFIKTGDEGREGILCVDFNRYNCFIKEEEYY